MMNVQAKPSDFFQEQSERRSINDANMTPITGEKQDPSSEDSIQSDYQTFLRLLTTQLEHQDPMSPTDPTEFLSQIAQFSTVEQQMKTNSTLEQMSQFLGGSVDRLDFGYLGREVRALGDIVGTDGTRPVNFAYSLEGSATEAEIVIRDKQNNIVKQMPADSSPGEHEVIWDGKTQNGEPAPEGQYKINIVALNEDEEPVASTVHITDTVKEVLKENGQTWLVLSGGNKVVPDNVTRVRDGNAVDA